MPLNDNQLQQASAGSLSIPPVDATADVYDIFLIGGQSNTNTGEGVDPVLDASVPGIFMYGSLDGEDGRALLASEPLHHARGIANNKIGFPFVFAKRYKIDNPDKKVLLVGSAQGATGFLTGQWVPGGPNNDIFFRRANEVIAKFPGSTLKGLLWHQGESDFNTRPTPAEYQAVLDAFFVQVRALPGAANLPIVAGELLQDYINRDTTDFPPLHQVILDIPTRVTNSAVTSSTSPTVLTDDPIINDDTHFSAASQRIFGDRYYDLFLTLQIPS